MSHSDRARREDAEPQPRRRDGLEVVRVREEGEGFIDGQGNKLSPLDAVQPGYQSAISGITEASSSTVTSGFGFLPKT